MRLAINYSPEAARLLADGTVEVDLFKCPDWPDLIAEAATHKPIYVHFPLAAGLGTLAETDWATLDELLGQSDSHVVNVHLKATSDDPDEVAESWLADLDLLSRRFGAERIVAENIIYFGPSGRTPAAATKPDLIGAVLRESGVGLLLDLAHARISALHYGRSTKEYLATLPTERLRELHVTGAGRREGRWRDHLAMTEEDWEVVAWALEHLGTSWAVPDIIAFEYGGVGPIFEWRSDAAVIAVDLPRLRTMVLKTERRLASSSVR